MNKRTQQSDGSCSNGQNRSYLELQTHQFQDKINCNQSQFSRAGGTRLSPYRLLQQRVANWETYKHQRPISHMPESRNPKTKVLGELVSGILPSSQFSTLLLCLHVSLGTDKHTQAFSIGHQLHSRPTHQILSLNIGTLGIRFQQVVVGGQKHLGCSNA